MTTVTAFQEFYRGPEDIPAEYREAEPPPVVAEAEADESLVMVCDTDLIALLMEMHALGGDYMRDAKHNLQTLAGGGTDFFVMISEHILTVTPAEALFHRYTTEHEIWMLMNKALDVRTFVVSVTERGRVTGNLCETLLKAMQYYIRDNSFYFTHLDAKMKDGTSRHIPATSRPASISRTRKVAMYLKANGRFSRTPTRRLLTKIPLTMFSSSVQTSGDTRTDGAKPIPHRPHVLCRLRR